VILFPIWEWSFPGRARVGRMLSAALGEDPTAWVPLESRRTHQMGVVIAAVLVPFAVIDRWPVIVWLTVAVAAIAVDALTSRRCFLAQAGARWRLVRARPFSGLPSIRIAPDEPRQVEIGDLLINRLVTVDGEQYWMHRSHATALAAMMEALSSAGDR